MRFKPCQTVFVAVLTVVFAGCSGASGPALLDSANGDTTEADDTNIEDSGDVHADGNPATNDYSGTADNIFDRIDDADPSNAENTGPELAVANDDKASYNSLAVKRMDELTARIVQLQTEVEELKATISQLRGTITSTEKAIAKYEDSTLLGKATLGAMSTEPQLRSDLGKLLQGKVRLVNNTGSNAVVYINGTAWTVLTGESYVLAPVGTVSFLRQGESSAQFMGMEEWTENPQTGQFELLFDLSRTTNEQSVLK